MSEIDDLLELQALLNRKAKPPEPQTFSGFADRRLQTTLLPFIRQFLAQLAEMHPEQPWVSYEQKWLNDLRSLRNDLESGAAVLLREEPESWGNP